MTNRAQEGRSGWRLWGVVLFVVALVVGGWALRNPGSTAADPGTVAAFPQGLQDIPLLRERTKGATDAAITIVEASDFQCPWCRRFWAEVLPHLDSEYIRTGKARLVFLNLPIPQLHPNALAAHEFAMCAAMQDRFWQVHDLLYRHQGAWAPLQDPAPYFRELADSARLDRGKLETCFSTGAVRQMIQQEVQMNQRAGIHSTPSFIVENGLLEGFHPIEVWRPILDSMFLAKTRRK